MTVPRSARSVALLSRAIRGSARKRVSPRHSPSMEAIALPRLLSGSARCRCAHAWIAATIGADWSRRAVGRSASLSAPLASPRPASIAGHARSMA